MQYPDRVFQILDPIEPQPVATTSATWVDTYEGVVDMLQELKEAKEIAVDLEHHDFRTYIGLVSLLQISTREKDWIVDTLKPWRHKLQVLNQVFADPTIVKVRIPVIQVCFLLLTMIRCFTAHTWTWFGFSAILDSTSTASSTHSLQAMPCIIPAEAWHFFFPNSSISKLTSGINWLIGEYGMATSPLQCLSLLTLIRPLPEEMMYYARSDTHYLLYIYDKIRNDLVQVSDRSNPDKDLITRVLEKSRELSLSRHENLEFNEETGEGSRGWFNFVLKNSHLAYKSDQFAVFRAIWKWRDVTARKEDENPNFVLGTNNLTEIARINPPDAKALHSMLPLTAALARSRVNEIWSLVQEEKAKSGPSLLQFFTSRDPASIPHKAGIPRVTKPQNQPPKLDAEVTATKLVRSQLFGNVAVSSQWDKTKGAVSVQEDYFPFPWQRFVEDTADVVVGSEPVQELAAAVEEPVKETSIPAAEEEQDEAFTLRRGKKRKSEAIENDESASGEADSASDGDEEMQDDVDSSAVIEIEAEEPAPGAARRAKKLEKKRKREEARAAQEQQHLELRTKRQEEKLARKEQRKNQPQADADNNNRAKYHAVPFDYSKAASVLHAKRDEAKETVQEEKKKAFDPYAKTGDDEIKPARRMPPIRGEKSATFKK